MNRYSFFSAGLAALAMMVSACSQTSNPTAPGTSSVGGTNGSEPGILSKLSEPIAYVDVLDNSNFRLGFSAYAAGTSDSEPMRATRAIDRVDFEVHAASGATISSMTAREVALSGVRTGEDGDAASLSVSASVDWPVAASVSTGSYVLAIVRGHNGEVLVRRANMPLGSSK